MEHGNTYSKSYSISSNLHINSMGLKNHIMNFETYNLFLDDIREPRECLSYTNEPRYGTREWVVVRTHDEFVQTVVNRWANGEFPELVSFDHDLADEHYSPTCGDADDYPTEFEEKTGLDSTNLNMVSEQLLFLAIRVIL